MMRMLLCAVALAALSATAAAAAEKAQPAEAESGRTLFICDTSAMTKRAFTREFGKVEFVTAAQVRKGGSWDAPKCITPAEARKLKQVATK
ncbi:hypothetical protein [uncultured Phenylobacterium sp.]|uniref:hypothetical protein n=1 Tax=uncultured Phenylobacterium sp. TaxID=349273 RepID=UPI0025F0F309|nr:hypothetical protein [uncultured Phenylobacterium sp.]